MPIGPERALRLEIPVAAMPASPSCAEAQLAGLIAAVQHNCDVIDARHARDSGLCTYLLGMREFFRWATDLDLGASPRPDAVGTWIGQRERQWERLLETGADALRAVPLDGGLDPFDEPAVNRRIEGQGLLYGAGIGRFGVPAFFLARLESLTQRNGVQVLVAGQELARGFSAAPAVSRGSTIVLRLDAFRRLLWTRAEAAARRDPADAFRMALEAYRRGDRLSEAIELMARGEMETLILHELGELRAAQVVGPDWESMLEQLGDRRAEMVVRAVRDLLADCLVTLPVLLERRATTSLDFWFSNFEGVRRALAPQWLDARAGGAGAIDVERLQRHAVSGRAQWSSLAIDLVGRWRQGGPDAVAALAGALYPA
jgi:hypothetical protein